MTESTITTPDLLRRRVTRCIFCGTKENIHYSGHLHLHAKMSIYTDKSASILAAYCDAHQLHLHTPLPGCASESGCFGLYDREKHGEMVYE